MQRLGFVPPPPASWLMARILTSPPTVGEDSENSAIPGECINKTIHSLSLYNSSREQLSDLLVALPQGNLLPPANASDQHPWRVIWVYHPIVETFSASKGGKRQIPDWTAHSDLDPAVQAELPSVLDLNAGYLLFHKTLRLVLFHNRSVVRYKFANWFDSFLHERVTIPICPGP